MLLADEDDRPRFERAALRWHSRYCQQARNVTLAEAQAVLPLLPLLPAPRSCCAQVYTCALRFLAALSGQAAGAKEQKPLQTSGFWLHY